MHIFHTHPDWTLDPPNHGRSKPAFLEYSGQGVPLTTHLHVVPRLKKEYIYTSNHLLYLHGLLQGKLHLSDKNMTQIALLYQQKILVSEIFYYAIITWALSTPEMSE